jgi:hypothetical protein
MRRMFQRLILCRVFFLTKNTYCEYSRKNIPTKNILTEELPYVKNIPIRNVPSEEFSDEEFLF